MAERSILYLFAHQDDELLILPKMMQDVRAGHVVRAVWITDGAKGGNPAKREVESKTVMGRVGVPAQNLQFLGFPDTRSAEFLPSIDLQLRQLAEKHLPAEIVSPAFEGGNMDHDVAAIVAARATQRQQPPPIHFEYPLYNRYHGKRQIGQFVPNAPAPINTIILDTAMRQFMEGAFKTYRTQRLGLWVLSLGGIKKKLLDRGVVYREAPAYDFLRRPVEEKLEYETSWTHRGNWENWVRAVKTLD